MSENSVSQSLLGRAPPNATEMTRYGDILSSLEQFFELCQRFSLRAEAEVGRFGVYRTQINQISAEIDQLRPGENDIEIYKQLSRNLPRYLVALGECGEIREMLPFLQMVSDTDELARKLLALIAGPELPSEEDLASNQARNIQFELWLASRLWMGGAKVNLAEPDLQCDIGEITILLACKRVLSVKKLTKRINHATKQLRRNLKSLPKDKSCGFVAISLSNLLGTERSRLVRDKSEALHRLASATEELILRGALSGAGAGKLKALYFTPRLHLRI